MALSLHTFRHTTPLDAVIEQVTGPNTVAASDDASPAQYATALIDDDVLVDALYEYRQRGWEHVGTGSVPGPVAVLSVDRARLTADASAITGTSWVTVLSVAITTVAGDTRLEIEASGTAAVFLAAGDARVAIDGGAIGSSPIPARILSILGSAPFAITWWEDLPAGSATYTIALQMRAGLTGSVTPQAGCALIAREYP